MPKATYADTSYKNLDRKLYDIVLDPEQFIKETEEILTNQQQVEMISTVMDLDTKWYFN